MHSVYFYTIWEIFWCKSKTVKQTTVVMLLFKPVDDLIKNQEKQYKMEEKFLEFAKKKQIPLITAAVIFEESTETVNLRHPKIEQKCIERFVRIVWYEM